jgi:acyl-coenzyme A thioesterase 13
LALSYGSGPRTGVTLSRFCFTLKILHSCPFTVSLVMASNSEQVISSPQLQSDPAIFEHITDQIKNRTQASPIYAFLLSDVVLTHASKGLIVARLTLSTNHINSGGSLHGGVSATFVDWAGGTAIAAYGRRARTGVSVDIHVEYLASARLGEEIEMEGRADRVGGSLAYTTVSIYRVRDGKRAEALVMGRHTKFVRGTAPVADSVSASGTV